MSFFTGRSISRFAPASARPACFALLLALLMAGFGVRAATITVQTDQPGAQLSLAGLGKISPDAKMTVLAGGPNDENSFAEPQKISPKEAVLKIPGPEFQHEFPANSFTVLRLKLLAL